MENIFDKKWMEIWVKAVKHRAVPAAPGPDSISISRTSFDDLVAIVEAAGRLSIPDIGVKSIHVTRVDGEFHCIAESPGFTKATGSGATFFEALSVAFQDFKTKTDARLE